MRRALLILTALSTITLAALPDEAQACMNAYEEIDKRDIKISRIREDLRADRFVETVAGALAYNADVRRAWGSLYPGRKAPVAQPLKGLSGRERKVLRLLATAVARADGAILVSRHAQAAPDSEPEVRSARINHAIAALRATAKKNKRDRIYLAEALARSTRPEAREEALTTLEALHAKKRLSTGHGYLALATLVTDTARAEELKARGEKLIKRAKRRAKRDSMNAIGGKRKSKSRAKPKRSMKDSKW